MQSGVPIALRRLPCLLLAALLAGPAQAVPVPVFFDGPFLASEPGDPQEHKGLSLDQVLASGLDRLVVPTYTVEGSLAVGEQSADGMVLPGDQPVPNEITSEWVVSNLFGDFGANAYLLFGAIRNEGGTSYNLDFTDEGCPPSDPLCSFEQHDRAGLMVDPVEGWRIIESREEGDTFFYLGILLDDFLNAGETCGAVTLLDAQTCVAIHYFLENPDAQLQPMGPDQLLPLPELQIMLAVVPEPATGSLVALGLAGLAAARRRRS